MLFIVSSKNPETSSTSNLIYGEWPWRSETSTFHIEPICNFRNFLDPPQSKVSASGQSSFQHFPPLLLLGRRLLAKNIKCLFPPLSPSAAINLYFLYSHGHTYCSDQTVKRSMRFCRVGAGHHRSGEGLAVVYTTLLVRTASVRTPAGR